ncbi:hypothetical protein niasHT_003598 [Heterodera trifolii]|uniref:C6 domain-containing protein n=1 Tax=Heterodera trifolii TaxID=157864 RepID=A0ABD2MES9_9BILA
MVLLHSSLLSISIAILLLLMPTILQSCHPTDNTAAAVTTAATTNVPTLTTASTAATTAGGGTAACTTCTATTLRLLTAAEAVASGLLQAIATTTPTSTIGANGAGCTTLTPTCGAGQVVSIHVLLANGATDFGNYNSGAITLECNSNGQWVVPAGAQHAGNVVDGFSCVTSAAG